LEASRGGHSVVAKDGGIVTKRSDPELYMLAATMRKRDWTPSRRELESVCARLGVLAVYEVGRIVGVQQLATAVDMGVREGWDPESRWHPDVETGET